MKTFIKVMSDTEYLHFDFVDRTVYLYRNEEKLPNFMFLGTFNPDRTVKTPEDAIADAENYYRRLVYSNQDHPYLMRREDTSYE